MVVIVLTPSVHGPYSRAAEFFDSALETTSQLIDNDNYDSAHDRIYEVKGLRNLHLEISNDGANGLTYRIENVTKFNVDADDVDSLPATAFKEIKGDTIVAASADDKSDIISISPESSFIRIRVKRETAGQNASLTGVSNLS